jgi:hypothetical protein
VIPEGTRDQGFKDSSEMLKNYKVLKIWQKSYELCIEKGVSGRLKKDIAEIERMLKALIKSLENKPWNPWTLFSN